MPQTGLADLQNSFGTFIHWKDKIMYTGIDYNPTKKVSTKTLQGQRHYYQF